MKCLAVVESVNIALPRTTSLQYIYFHYINNSVERKNPNDNDESILTHLSRSKLWTYWWIRVAWRALLSHIYEYHQDEDSMNSQAISQCLDAFHAFHELPDKHGSNYTNSSCFWDWADMTEPLNSSFYNKQGFHMAWLLDGSWHVAIQDIPSPRFEPM